MNEKLANMTPPPPPNGMLLDDIVSPKKKKEKKIQHTSNFNQIDMFCTNPFLLIYFISEPLFSWKTATTSIFFC